MRALSALDSGPDWDSITPAQLVEAREAQERVRRSALGALVNGRPDRGAHISTHALELPGRTLSVRVYRPSGGGTDLPLIVAFHGGGFITGVPGQDDWLLSHLAAAGPAVVASLDYRLAPEHVLPAAVEDACEATPLLLARATQWGADGTRLALLGSSAGATLAVRAADHAAALGLRVRTQVLINPQIDWTDAVFEYPSFTENAESPTATPANCRAVQRLAMRPGFDARTVSPMYLDVTGTAPVLIQSAGLDPLEDHSPAYAERLRAAGVEVTLTRYPRATHAFLSMPGLVSAARPARAEVLAHLRSRLAATKAVQR
ncbi:alpha/beta hydrolase fold domain-containing protein [Nocardia halotolerans]|uniref:Alpha/beta hydrolase fold domain-containing protein n=1 Tax=Nocardia halotolerans TaxID=1755878 RepID=A0ABV8VEI8_9NOCA